MKILPLFLLLITFFPKAHSDQSTAVLTVDVFGAKPNKGEVILSLFTSEENYLKDPELTLTEALDSKGNATFTLPKLPSGTYSLSAVYDEDGNGKLNTGLMGIPKEFVGFSNNVKGLFGPPKFDKTSFEVSSQTNIAIVLGKAEN